MKNQVIYVILLAFCWMTAYSESYMEVNEILMRGTN